MPKTLPVVLVVDDKPNMVRLMSKVLKRDARVLTADGGAEALRVLATEHVDLVLCDLKMPDMDGLDVLKASKRLRRAAEFILMTAYASVGTAVEALKLGAYDYITKPFEPDEVRDLVLSALSKARVAHIDDSPFPEVLPGLIAKSRVMQDLGELVKKLAASQATTLVLGETGVGKERVARAIHALSDRASQRFVAVNCAAIPADLLESELFGHTKGSFTGATSDRKGLFEDANGGTLFLDEVGDMRPSLQAKLTRVLEERAVRRVGESVERPVDVRLVGATHRDLPAMVKAGTFREDLMYRLNVAQVVVPPLRERDEDIPLLAKFFLAQHSERGRIKATGFSADAEALLAGFDWPGNVRQLRSAVERASAVATGDLVQIEDLPPELSRSGASGALSTLTWSEALERGRLQVGRQYLEDVLRRYQGNVQDAAEQAGVERESFYRLLRKHGVDAAAFRVDE
ncbi:MAG: sigma-54 dependent transcriptional regulator [bacterium]